MIILRPHYGFAIRARQLLMSEICIVTLDELVEIDGRQVQPPYKYGYAYTIAIHNISPYTVQIRSRKWIIRDGDMKDRIVEGEGVVGQLPIIESGEKFVYQSFHIMQSRYGSATGAYYGVYTYESDPVGYYTPENIFMIDGDAFEVEIPEFQLIHRD